MSAPHGTLRVEDLEAGYPGSFALPPMSFEVPAGSVVGVVGPNGGGKSTLLKAIAGILPLAGGRVTLAGRPLERKSGSVAYVPQREDVNWAFPVSALDVVTMGRYRRIGWVRPVGAADRRAAREALERLGLGGLGGRHISEFSGGQQQRIFLARALVQEPALVLLDEPFTGIDTANRAVFHEAIRDFAAGGVTVLMATHDLEEVVATTTHVAMVADELVAFGPTAATFTPEALKRAFGGRLAVFS